MSFSTLHDGMSHLLEKIQPCQSVSARLTDLRDLHFLRQETSRNKQKECSGSMSRGERVARQMSHQCQHHWSRLGCQYAVCHLSSCRGSFLNLFFLKIKTIIPLPWWRSGNPCLDLYPLFQNHKVLCPEVELVGVAWYTGCSWQGRSHGSHWAPHGTSSHPLSDAVWWCPLC